MLKEGIAENNKSEMIKPVQINSSNTEMKDLYELLKFSE
jgi:hypothetical protein